MKPRVFIGSSTEGLPIARALQNNLEGDAEITVWEQNVFKPSEYILESLLKQLESTDFGIFVFSPDDVMRIRGQEQAAVRDNVIFEFGLFVGHLGRQHSVMLLPKGFGKRLRIPSDLWGVNVLTFDPKRKDRNLEAAVGPASNNIRSQLLAVSSVKAEIPEELEVPIWERRQLLTEGQSALLTAIEKSGESSGRDLLRRFPKFSEDELFYRLEQLRLFRFITVRANRNDPNPRNARYALRDSYRKVYNKHRERIRRIRPAGPRAP